MHAQAVFYLLVGLALLVGGAEALVRGASRLAASLGVSPLVIGLTIVAYGTSAPELSVSIGAAMTGEGDLSLGNVLGSNIFNVFVVLGLSAIVAPLVVARQLVRLEVWLMIAISSLALLMSLDGSIGRLDGALLATGAVMVTIWYVRQGKSPEGTTVKRHSSGDGLRDSRWKSLGLIAAGLGLLVWGSDWLVEGSITLARAIGVSELVIGLTVVAAGTSLPELATSVVASIRGERDIAVGNVIGSNIFNLLAVLGLSAVVIPGGVAVPESARAFDFPVMIASAVACLPVFFTGYRIDRWEGALLLGYYCAYVVYLLLDATHSGALEFYRSAMVWFVLPLTAVTLVVVSLHHWNRSAQGRQS